MSTSHDTFFTRSGSSPPSDLRLLERVPREHIPALIAALAAHLMEPEPEQENGRPTGNALLTADQVAERLSVDRKWVYTHRDELGGLNLSRKRLRFPSDAVERYIQRRKAATARGGRNG